MQAFKPKIAGFPSPSASVTILPRMLAGGRVLPDDEGVGPSRSISRQRLLSRISTKTVSEVNKDGWSRPNRFGDLLRLYLTLVLLHYRAY